MLSIMLFAAAIAIVPALLNSSTPVPASLTRVDEDVRAAMERAR